MSFLKHIGRHGDRKVAVVFKQIPGDEHMCLVIYPDLLPMHIHDPIMKVLESTVGQAADELADVLHRNLLPDGRNMLETLHAERVMKRIQTEQVILTPNASSTVKLSELNDILNQMKQGADAVRKMTEIDQNSGLVDAKTKREAERKFKEDQLRRQQPASYDLPQATADGVLDDRTLAANMLSQAQRMEMEAQSLIKEAARMKKEAEQLSPAVKPAKAVKQTVNADAVTKKPRSTTKARVTDAAQ
jgi:predicted esterase YcpF (UPF0227 family)